MTPKKCMSIAKSLTNTQHMELEPLCTDGTTIKVEGSSVATTTRNIKKVSTTNV